MRVVLVATNPQQCTGYARVGAAIANGLAERGHAVVYFGIHNYAGTAGRVMRPGVSVVDVAARDASADPENFGYAELPDVVRVNAPDVVVLYNDILVVNQYLQHLTDMPPHTRVVCYMDLVHDDEDLGLIKAIDAKTDGILVFTPHWKTHLVDVCGVDASKISVVPHGLDPCFRTVDVRAARRRLHLPPRGFIVLNSNRNSYRKALDVTIRCFLEMVASLKATDAYLLLNNVTDCPTGYDIPAIIRRESLRLGLDPEEMGDKRVLRLVHSGYVPDAIINDLYNACDVGINTCVGEGFGLCSMEHASLGRPQVVNAVGGLRDIFGKDAVEPIERLELCRGFIRHGGSMMIPDSKAFVRRLAALYEDYTTSQESRRSRVLADVIRTKYSWTRILDDLEGILSNLCEPRKQ